MRVALFVPCYVDQLRPSVAHATLALLERCGFDVDFPEAQTCCGQAHLNSGGARDARVLATRFLEIFAPYEKIVCPSASCVATVTQHYGDLLPVSPELLAIRAKTRELSAFLATEVPSTALRGRWQGKIGIQPSCHGLRELRQGRSTERRDGHPFDPLRNLLENLEGAEIVDPVRTDECCGFGGAFCVEEPGVSRLMGLDRLRDHERAGASVVTSSDVSCLLHLEGLARRERVPLEFRHVAELLECATRDPS